MSVHSPNPQAEHLLRLSSEVSRIAGTLAQLSGEPDRMQRPIDPNSKMPEIPVTRVNAVIRARRLRDRFFPGDLFADPAWDMMLDLFKSELLQQRVAVSSLCVAAAVPATTALRWLNTLVQRGLVMRRPDPMDARRVFVELAPDASLALRRYFAEAADGHAI